MITRQKVLLSILREADGKASRMQVTKWAFLLRHETESHTLAAQRVLAGTVSPEEIRVNDPLESVSCTL